MEQRALSLQQGMQAAPRAILKSVFGFEDFRPGQEDIVAALLAGRDVLAVMPVDRR